MQLKSFPIYLFAIAIFLPLPFNILLMSMSLCFAFIYHGLNKKDILLYLFLIAGLLVSLIHQNILGFYGMLAMCVVALNISIFTEISFDRDKIYLILLIGSIFCAVIGMVQYLAMIEVNGLPFFPLQVLDEASERITSVFFNANYYATILELLILLGIDCLIRQRLKKLALISLPINFFMLYLCGCRSAWVALAVAIPFLFFIHRQFYILKVVIVVEVIIIIGIFCFPHYCPRLINSSSDLSTRITIWQASLRFIFQHPLSFKGPLSYMMWCERYILPKTQHAHQLWIDLFLNFGFLSFLLFPFIKRIWKLNQKNLRIRKISPFLLAMLIHSLSDATLFWIQTSALFLLLLL